MSDRAGSNRAARKTGYGLPPESRSKTKASYVIETFRHLFAVSYLVTADFDVQSNRGGTFWRLTLDYQTSTISE